MLDAPILPRNVSTLPPHQIPVTDQVHSSYLTSLQGERRLYAVENSSKRSTPRNIASSADTYAPHIEWAEDSTSESSFFQLARLRGQCRDYSAHFLNSERRRHRSEDAFSNPMHSMRKARMLLSVFFACFHAAASLRALRASLRQPLWWI